MIMGQVATRQSRRNYPIIPSAERLPDSPEFAAAAQLAETAGRAAFGLGLQFKRQQEEDKIEADGVSALNAQVALDKYDYDELKRIDAIEFGSIEDFDTTYSTYNKGRQSYIETLLSEKNEDVKQSINAHALKTEVSSQSRYYNQLDRHKTRFAQTQFYENQQIIANGNEDDEQKQAAMLANIEANNDFFTPAQVNAFKAGVGKEIAVAQHNAYLEAVAFTTRRLPLDDALKYINEIPRTKITEAERNGLLNQRNFEAAQQKLEYDQQLEKIEINYLAKLKKEQLSEDELMADLEAGRIDTDLYKEYANYVDAQTTERLKGESERDWDKYDELQGMVKDYGDGARTDERVVRDAISDAVKVQDITSTDGMKLLDRVKKSDDTDDPLNRSDVKRGLGVFGDLESAEISANKDEPYETIRGIRLKYQKKKDEYENWIKSQDKLTGTDIQNKTAEMTEAIVAEELPGIIDRAFKFWLQSSFGALGRKVLGIEKEEEEPAKKKILKPKKPQGTQQKQLFVPKDPSIRTKTEHLAVYKELGGSKNPEARKYAEDYGLLE